MEIEAVASSYRRWAPVYDETFGAFTRLGRRKLVRHVNRRAGSVLEVGVGTGLSLPHYAPHLQVTGIDFSGDMLERARARVTEKRLAHVEALLRMDARALEFPDDHFDTVVAMHLISVVPEPERVMAEMARVCKPGGEVLILNHFLHEKGALATLSRKLAPLANTLGWHPDFPIERALSAEELELVDERRSPPLGMFTRLHLRKRDIAPVDAV